MQSYTLSLTVGIITGLLGFIMGALLQQDASYRGIQTAMENDPYIYQSRQQIYGALRLVGRQRGATLSDEMIEKDAATNDSISRHRSNRSHEGHTCESQDTEDSVYANYRRWFQASMQAVTMFFTFSLGDEPQMQPEPCTHVAALMKYGFPGLDDIHVYRNFVLSYDRRNRIAHWVCEHLDGDCLSNDETNNVGLPDFNVDSSIPLMFRATPRDYRNTDWVAGQMASPHNYKCNELDYIETYLMPNIAPVSQGLKTNIWSRLETYVRELAINCGSVYVYTGPLFMPQRITFRNWAIRHRVIGMNTVAVPTHFFKVIIAECKNNEQYPYVEGYVVPNVDIDKNLELSTFLSDIQDIEHFAGLKFFDGLRWPHLQRKPTNNQANKSTNNQTNTETT